MAGITPEAPDAATALARREPAETIKLGADDLAVAWRALDSGRDAAAAAEASDPVELVAVGNPHLSLTECATLAALCADAPAARLHPEVRMVATMGRAVYEDARAAGHTATLKDFGVEFVTDTCWWGSRRCGWHCAARRWACSRRC